MEDAASSVIVVQYALKMYHLSTEGQLIGLNTSEYDPGHTITKLANRPRKWALSKFRN